MALATVSSFLTGKPVDFATFVELCQKLALEWKDIAELNVDSESHAISKHQDWGEAPDVTAFYGRTSGAGKRSGNLQGEGLYSNALSSVWGETLISRWLKRRKFVNFSQTDERALCGLNKLGSDILVG